MAGKDREAGERQGPGTRGGGSSSGAGDIYSVLPDVAIFGPQQPRSTAGRAGKAPRFETRDEGAICHEARSGTVDDWPIRARLNSHMHAPCACMSSPLLLNWVQHHALCEILRPKSVAAARCWGGARRECMSMTSPHTSRGMVVEVDSNEVAARIGQTDRGSGALLHAGSGASALAAPPGLDRPPVCGWRPGEDGGACGEPGWCVCLSAAFGASLRRFLSPVALLVVGRRSATASSGPTGAQRPHRTYEGMFSQVRDAQRDDDSRWDDGAFAKSATVGVHSCRRRRGATALSILGHPSRPESRRQRRWLAVWPGDSWSRFVTGGGVGGWSGPVLGRVGYDANVQSHTAFVQYVSRPPAYISRRNGRSNRVAAAPADQLIWGRAKGQLRRPFSLPVSCGCGAGRASKRAHDGGGQVRSRGARRPSVILGHSWPRDWRVAAAPVNGGFARPAVRGAKQACGSIGRGRGCMLGRGAERSQKVDVGDSGGQDPAARKEATPSAAVQPALAKRRGRGVFHGMRSQEREARVVESGGASHRGALRQTRALRPWASCGGATWYVALCLCNGAA